MRHARGKVSLRSVTLLVASMVLVAAVFPAIAAAATPKPPLVLSKTVMVKAAPFKIYGKMSPLLKGKKVSVMIRKPGRTFWTTVGTPTIGKTGTYSLTYTPKLGGTFLVQSQYGSTKLGLSRVATMKCLKGPGVRYELKMSSTTSTRDSGLWEALKVNFIQQCPEYATKARFVGTGAAIADGCNGNADVLLVHSPVQEVAFMKGIAADGSTCAYKGLTRFKVMYNDFILVGPKTDPADIGISDTAKTAFGKVAAKESKFWSRNDKSGTNTKEKEIWKSIGDPQLTAAGKPQAWYQASGTMGMAAALSACDQGNGYTLSDRATWMNWLNLQDFKPGSTTEKNVSIEIVNEGDSTYFNQYSVMEVAKAKNWEGAQDFRRWIMSSAAQAIIRQYGEDTFGKALFIPNAGSYPAGS